MTNVHDKKYDIGTLETLKQHDLSRKITIKIKPTVVVHNTTN